MTCLVKSAEAAPAPAPLTPRFVAWVYCSTCKQRFTGLVALRLVIALWAKHARTVETNMERIVAAVTYAGALFAAGESAEAERLERGLLGVYTRVLGPEHEEAAALLRTTLTVQTRTLGADDVNALITESLLADALYYMGEYAAAEALGRGTLEKRRRVLGRDHRDTLLSPSDLATSLSWQGKHVEVVEIERKVLVSTTRLLGAEHEGTLITAFNLAVSLSQCGQNMECKQILRETLAQSQRALGPTVTQQLTQKLLGCMRDLGLAAR